MSNTGSPLFLEKLETLERSPEVKVNAFLEKVNEKWGELTTSAAKFSTAKELSLSGSTILEFDELAEFLEAVGTLTANTYIELPAPVSGRYVVHITNSCSGAFSLYVQKTGGVIAVEVLAGQTKRIIVES